MLKHIPTQLKTGSPHAEIAALAYEYWEKSGRQPGHAHEHWLKAEASLRASARLPDSRAALTPAPGKTIVAPAAVSQQPLGRISNGSARRQLASH
jgi:hypothetical protein